MNKLFTILILLFSVLFFFAPFLFQNQLPIPADTIIGLYNPFRDLYARNYPRGVPFKNFLITDPVRQQYPWRFESILQEKLGQLPLWNPYNFAGTPLLANQQSAPFSPFNLLFFILPFSYTWSLLILLQPILASIFFYFYLKNLKINSLASAFGATAFVFSGFFISWLEWGTVDSVIMWLPLGLLSIDKAFSTSKKIPWYGVILISLTSAFFAGHLQTFFYIFLAIVSYFVFRFFESEEKQKHLLYGFCTILLFIALTLIQSLPLLQFILSSARDSDLTITTGWYIPWQHLVTFFVPDFFGNPTTLNYWGVWNYAELTGYIGIPALSFAVYSIFVRWTKITAFFTTVLIASLLFALPNPIAVLPFILHVPFLSTAQPTRLLSLIDFSLCILSAYGMHIFLKSRNKRILFPIGIFAFIFASIWGIVLLHQKVLLTVSLANITTVKHNLILPTAVFTLLTFLVITVLLFKKRKIIVYIALACIVFLSLFDTVRFAQKFTPFTSSAYLFPSTSTLTFLKSHIGNFRVMTTSDQILPPNFSIMYHLQSVDGYDPLYSKTYGEFTAAMGRGKPDISTPFGFNRLITPHRIQSRLTDLLGVKYVLSLTPIDSSKFIKVYQEGQTLVYENTKVIPRAFFIKNIHPALTNQQEVNFLFDNSFNLVESATAMDYSDVRQFSLGKVAIVKYAQNSVTLQTENNSKGFLVLTDSYYPTWHAFVDGKETKIYQTDLTFRGIELSKGKHMVVFQDSLF